MWNILSPMFESEADIQLKVQIYSTVHRKKYCHDIITILYIVF